VIPAMRAEAQALAAEIERIGSLRSEIDKKQSELGAARADLDGNRAELAQLVARRLDLDRRLLPADPGTEARIAKLGRDARDPAELIKRADAAIATHDKELLTRLRRMAAETRASAPAADAVDPTRPRDLRAFEPSSSLLTVPLAGTLTRRFAAADAPAGASQGLSFAALPGGAVVAPFDGRIVYAGRFGELGLILIIRHGGLYHSLLAGLGRIDSEVEDWVVAGEPVGAMPDASGAALYFELRREGRPVDPQPWLAAPDTERGGQDGDQKVRE